MQSLFLSSTFCLVSLTVFSPFCFGCVFFSRIEYFGLVLSFDIFVFYSFVVRLQSGLQKHNLSIFNLVLVWRWLL